jgi:predicted short-subunit dehydrogenase-like oxidoreductase (DUF2520 family)
MQHMLVCSALSHARMQRMLCSLTEALLSMQHVCNACSALSHARMQRTLCSLTEAVAGVPVADIPASY